jgi:F0F1-type ATP synthase assembly protein I
VASVIGFTALGYWLDRKMGHSVQWLLLVGAAVGMLLGFVSFFRKVLRAGRSRWPARRRFGLRRGIARKFGQVVRPPPR